MATESVTEVEGQLLYVQYLTDNGQHETSAAVLVNDGSATFVILLDDQGFQRPGFDPIPFPFAEDSPFSIVDGDNSIVPYDEAADQRSNLDASETGDLESRDADDSRFVEVRQKRKYRKRSIKLEADEDEYYYGRDTEESYLQIHDDLLLSCESFESPYLTDEVEMEQFPEGKKISLLTTKMHAAESVKPRKYEYTYEAGHEFPRKRTNEKVRKLNLTDTTIRMMRENACKRPRDEAGRFIPGENRRKKKQAENAMRRGRPPSAKATPTPKRSGKLKLNEDALFHAIQRASGKDSDKKSDSEGVTVKAETDEEGEEEDASVPYGNGVNAYSLSSVQTDGAEDSLLSQASMDNDTLPQTDGAAWFSDDSLPAFPDAVSNKATIYKCPSQDTYSAHTEVGISDKLADQENTASVSTSDSKDTGCVWQGLHVSEDVLEDVRKKELKIVLKKVDVTSTSSNSDTAFSVEEFTRDMKAPQLQASLHSMTVTVGSRRSVHVDNTIFPLARLTSSAPQSVLITDKATKRLSSSTIHTASKRQALAHTTQPDNLTLTFFPDMTAPNTDTSTKATTA